MKITRREALKTIGAAAGAAIVGPTLAGCSDDTPVTPGNPDAPRSPDSPVITSPDAGPTADAPPPGKIDHIVIVMMENRSYDHFFGARKLIEGRPGDGLVAGMGQRTNADVFTPIYRETMPCVTDPPHDNDAGIVQLNGGANDGFLKIYETRNPMEPAPRVVGYFQREDLPVSYALADAYTSFDRWFCSYLGPTFPNRWYLHSGQSDGRDKNDFVMPPDKWRTIYDNLDAAGISWKYYYTDLPFLFTMGYAFDDPHFFSSTKFITEDAPNGQLPSVSVIDPSFSLNDDHPPHHPLLGQQFISSIYTALAESPHWKNSLMVVTYDECGGFFDHVAPPTAPDERAAQGFNQLGFRVPTVLMGPYVKKNFVSSVVHDHTSVLKQIENMFNVPSLTMRDAAANDLSDALDLDRLARNQPDDPITLPAVTVDIDMLDPKCKMSDFDDRHDLEKMADAGLFPPGADKRKDNRKNAFLIADYLQARGLGGMKGPR